MSDGQFLTRRQLRELEKSGKDASQFANELVSQAPDSITDIAPEVNETIELVVAAAFFDDDFIANSKPPIVERPAMRWPANANQSSTFRRSALVGQDEIARVIENSVEIDDSVDYLEEPDISNSDFFTQSPEVVDQLFEVSPNLILEPTTNSIVIETFDSLDNYTGTISETGEILKTGSIELPLQMSNTGELEIIADAESLDEAIASESASGYVSTIAPVRATGIVNSASRFKILPANLRKGQGQVYLVLTAAVLMVFVGGLTIAAFMLGII